MLQKVQSGDESAKTELEQLREEKMNIKAENRTMLQERAEIKEEVRQEVGNVIKDMSNTTPTNNVEVEEESSQVGQVQKGNKN